ncbi:MAG: hypothetical protein KBD64_03110, partial [Gammaproteobacteria bacterium]|nr:hypothetical protein [Gammaproteobacteria bacterium]
LELTDISEFTPETFYYSIISIELADEIAEESLKAKPDLELDLKDSVVETQKAVCNLARYQLLLNSISGEKSTTDLFKVLIPKCPSTNFRLYTGTIKQSLSTFDFFKALAADPEAFKQKFLDIFPIDETPNHHLVFNFLYELFINIMQARSNIDQIISNDNKKWLKFRSEYLPPEIDKPMWRLKELPESRGGSTMPDTLRSAAPELRLFSRILPQLSPGPSDEPLSPRTEKVLRRLLL